MLVLFYLFDSYGRSGAGVRRTYSQCDCRDRADSRTAVFYRISGKVQGRSIINQLMINNILISVEQS